MMAEEAGRNFGAQRFLAKAYHNNPTQRHLAIEHWFTSPAPEREELFAKARDPANGDIYRLPFKVYRQGAHFYNAKTNNPLKVEIVTWSYNGKLE